VECDKCANKAAIRWSGSLAGSASKMTSESQWNKGSESTKGTQRGSADMEDVLTAVGRRKGLRQRGRMVKVVADQGTAGS
jgi:hypothetical protein